MFTKCFVVFGFRVWGSGLSLGVRIKVFGALGFKVGVLRTCEFLILLRFRV